MALDSSHEGGIFGVSRAQAAAFAQLISKVGNDDTLYLKTLVALALIANNFKWQAAADFHSLLSGVEVSAKTARRNFEEVAEICEFIPQKSLRFRHRDPRFPGCTSIVDGTVVRCRNHRSEVVLQKRSGSAWVECKPPPSIADTYEEEQWLDELVEKCVEERDPKYRLIRVDRTYSGKHGARCWKFDVFVTMAGVPFAFRGPVPGSTHDKKLYDLGTMFEHGEREQVLADLGYVAARHCVVPFKGEVTEEQRHYNNHHAVVRSRIERFFAYLDVFKVFQGTDLQEANIKRCMTIAVAVMFAILAKDPQYDVESPKEQTEQKLCLCNSTLKHAQEFNPDEIRERYCAALKDIPCEPKKARKRGRREETWMEDAYHRWKAGAQEEPVVE